MFFTRNKYQYISTKYVVLEHKVRLTMGARPYKYYQLTWHHATAMIKRQRRSSQDGTTYGQRLEG